MLADVPFTFPLRRAMTGRLTREQRLRRRLEDVLVGVGSAEVITPSLRADDADPSAIRLEEPLSSELALLRTELLPSLVDFAGRNVEAGNRDIALFEIAHVYVPRDEELPDEPLRLAGILEGGFGEVKGVVEAIYAALKASPLFAPAEHPLLHPGKTARTEAGVFGEVHPAALDGSWGAFELDLKSLLAVAREPVRYEDVITFPSLRQDLAFIVAEGRPGGRSDRRGAGRGGAGAA